MPYLKQSHSWLLLILLGVLLSSAAYTPEMVPNVQVQNAQRYVSDPEEHFSSEERARMDAALSSLRQQYGIEAVLVVVPEVINDDPLDFTVKLFELWGLGNKELDNGLLILYIFEPEFRTIRFEVGYGLEGILSDGRSHQLITQILVPAIKQGDEVGGFMQLFDELENLLEEGEEGGLLQEEEPVIDDAVASMLADLYFILSALFALGYVIQIIVPTVRSPRPAVALNKLYDKKNGCAVFAMVLFFPSIFFILPTYFLLKLYYRREAKNCPQCGSRGTVSRTDLKDSTGLTPLQAVERKIQSRKFQLLSCSACSYKEGIGKPVRYSKYTRCPNCHGLTFYEADVKRISESKSLRTRRCKYCNHTKKDYVLSETTSTVGGGGGYGRGGGRSYGGGGGGFGGGSSGGGGATIRF
ncbi:MAG: TPM domain-containing protein [Porphyromonas sp.]|nr:TPM domain-containing protein [Porphyromonas sp.]